MIIDKGQRVKNWEKSRVGNTEAFMCSVAYPMSDTGKVFGEAE